MSPDPARLEALLAETAWVRALARRLCSDSAAADDLVQDTWLAALRHQPDERGSPRAWLGKVLVNLHLARRRTEANRGARERSAARHEALPSSSDVVERVQSSRMLVEHVLELEEPYRSAVLARFFDGLSAEEIARREGLPSSTIRTRIQRGIEKLRARLEHGKGSGWLAALVPLARLESSTGTLGTGIAGGLVMAAGAKFALGLCAASICAWLFLPKRAPTEAGTPPIAVGFPAESSLPPAHSEPIEDLEAAARKSLGLEAQLPGQGARVGSFKGHVLRRVGGVDSPVSDAAVALLHSTDTQGSLEDKAQGRTREDGSFEFAGLVSGYYTLRARIGTGLRAECIAHIPESAMTKPVEFVFGSARIHGDIRDERGAAASGAPITINCMKTSAGDRLLLSTTADANGAWDFVDLPSGLYWVRIGKGPTFDTWPDRLYSITLADGDDIELTPDALEPPVHWRGTIRATMGAAVTSGTVLQLERKWKTHGSSEVRVTLEHPLDSSGRFDLVVEPGDWEQSVGLDTLPGSFQCFKPVAVPIRGLERDIVVRGTRLSGLVLDAATHQPLRDGAREWLVRATQGEGYEIRTTKVDPSGRYEFDMLEEGEYELSTSPGTVRAEDERAHVKLEWGETARTLDLVLRKP